LPNLHDWGTAMKVLSQEILEEIEANWPFPSLTVCTFSINDEPWVIYRTSDGLLSEPFIPLVPAMPAPKKRWFRK